MKDDPNRHSALSRSATQFYVLTIIGLVVFYLTLKRFSGGVPLSFEFASISISSIHECSFSIHAWSPFSRCISEGIGYLFQRPPIYFSLLVVLLFFKILVLYNLLLVFVTNEKRREICQLIALCGLVLLTIGGFGRFLIGSMSVLTLADVTLRTIAQIFILLGINKFFQQRFTIASLLFCPAILTAATSTVNIIAILGISLLWTYKKDSFRELVLPSLLIMVTICFQYWSVISGYEIDNYNLSDSFVSLDEWRTFKNIEGIQDWSTLFHIQQPLGAFYVFMLGGCILLAKELNPGLALSKFVGLSPVALCLASIAYFLIVLFIEALAKPEILVEQLMTIAPRRALYLPVLGCVVILSNMFRTDTRKSVEKWPHLVVLTSLVSALNYLYQ